MATLRNTLGSALDTVTATTDVLSSTARAATAHTKTWEQRAKLSAYDSLQDSKAASIERDVVTRKKLSQLQESDPEIFKQSMERINALLSE